MKYKQADCVIVYSSQYNMYMIINTVQKHASTVWTTAWIVSNFSASFEFIFYSQFEQFIYIHICSNV